MPDLKVLQTGPYATIQDFGRIGFQQYGVPLSGVLDRYGATAANLLVGNRPAAPVIEMTFAGMKLEATGPVLAALTGAGMPVLINDEPAQGWMALELKAGDIITIKPAITGLRGYLAISGGFEVPEVMGSASTYVGGKLGGFKGRVLAKCDELSCRGGDSARAGKTVPRMLRPNPARKISLRALPGPQDDYFNQGLATFFNGKFKVSAQADRMGYRLEGPGIEIKEGKPASIISEPSLAGAVQIPAGGQPIILLVEQTVGGYAKIATVVSADLDMIAQARPGDGVVFQRIDAAKARDSAMEYQKRLAILEQALA